MALIKCSDCGTDVSEAAPACPKCGRPTTPTSVSSNAWSEKARSQTSKRSAATITVTLSSFVLISIGIFVAVWFIPSFEIGQNIEASCKVNGFGNGSCQFTNTGWTPGSQCVDVRLINKKGASVSSGPLCSGLIWPNDTIEKDISIVIGNNCNDSDSLLPDLDKACKMDIHDVGATDASESSDVAQASSNSQPATSAPNTADSMSTGTENSSIASVSAATPDVGLSDQDAASAQSQAATGSESAAAVVLVQNAASAASASTPSIVSVPPKPSSVSAIATPSPTTDNESRVLQAIVAKTSGPSFDCLAAASTTERAICSNTELSHLDRKMAILYYSRTNYANDSKVRTQQRNWIHERNWTCGADVACLRSEYDERINQLDRTKEEQSTNMKSFPSEAQTTAVPGGLDSSPTSSESVAQSNLCSSYLARVSKEISVRYPIEALRAGHQGTVILNILVDRHGQPLKARIVKSSGYPELDSAAQEGVMQYSYIPASKDCHATQSWIQIPINFNPQEF